MKTLILEDRTERIDALRKQFDGDEIFIAKNFAEAEALLEFIQFDQMSLDHDLEDFVQGPYGQIERTGKDVCHIIANLKVKPQVVFIHSWNVKGRDEMLAILKDAGINAVLKQFDTGNKRECPCTTMDEELLCKCDVCIHTNPRRGWVKVSNERINIVEELVHFEISATKGAAKRLIEGGAVKVWDGAWNKTFENFLPAKETFLMVGKKAIVLHLLIPKE